MSGVLHAPPATPQRELDARRRASEQGYAQGRAYVDALVGMVKAIPTLATEVKVTRR